MFSKTALFSLVTLALSALAVPTNPTYSCNTGTVQCCNRLANSQTASGAALLHNLIGAAAQGVTGQFGVHCNPIGVVAAQGNSCTTQPVCCDKNNINSLVSVGCTPANVNV